MTGAGDRRDYGSPLAYIDGVSRNKTITAKVSQRDLSKIDSLLSSTGLTRSAFIREAVMAVVEFIEGGGCEAVNGALAEREECASMKALKNLCNKILNNA
ncbi:MAG: ribbon-helix-helix domain-containing protein [Desulfurococcales archaeon]|nr:ribbon-helix-helix domain-containing protein [Desulfurococcales archaeon]